MVVEKYKSEDSDFFKNIEKKDMEEIKNPKKTNKEELITKDEDSIIENENNSVIKEKVNNKINNIKKLSDKLYDNSNPIEIIKPKLKFLEDIKDSNKVYIGRKKSVLKQYGSIATAYIGKVAEEQSKDKKVYLDGLNPHIVFLDGARGTGKSYLLGVIAEELVKTNPYIGQIVIDPVGVFWSMKFPNREKKELELLTKWNIKPEGINNIKVFVPEGICSQLSKETYDGAFSLFPSLLNSDDWCLTFGLERFSPSGLLLEKTLDCVKKGYDVGGTKDNPDIKKIKGKGSQFTLEDIIFCLQNNSEFASSQKGYKIDSIRALVSRFDAAKSWGIFSDHGTPLSKLSRESQLTILDTSFLDDNITALVIGILARRILSARKLLAREGAIKRLDNKKEDPDKLLEIEIPPTWMYIDEAHTLIPSGNTQTPATAGLIEYVKQGRRPGCSLVFATQQPSAINTKVLSQVDILISNKLVFNDDIRAIQKRMPTIIPNTYKTPNFIKTLPFATALVGDRSEETSRAFILKIRPRSSQHEGRDVETVREIPKLSSKQIIVVAANMIYKKLEINKELQVNYAKDILDIINIRYKSEISWDEILESLLSKGVFVKDNYLFLNENKSTSIIGQTDTDEHKEKIKESELKKSEVKESSEILENVKEPIISRPKIYKCLPSRISKEAVESKINSKIKKSFIFFKPKEHIQSSILNYRPIYKIDYNLYDKEENFVKKVCYIDSVTGEFLHFNNSYFIESHGLNLLDKLSEEDLEILFLLKKQQTLFSLSHKLNITEDQLSERIDFFKQREIISYSLKNNREVYKLSHKFDIPFDASNKLIDSISSLPLKKKEIDNIEPINFSTTQIQEFLEKLWGDVEFISLEEIYWPIWHITLVDKSNKQKIERIDGVIGQLI